MTSRNVVLNPNIIPPNLIYAILIVGVVGYFFGPTVRAWQGEK